MGPEPLILPRGVRLVRPDEIPDGAPGDWAPHVEEAHRTSITTGYTRRDVTGEEFVAVIEANVHAPDLWRVFAALVDALLPAAAAPIAGMKDEDPILGDYTTRQAALRVLEHYQDPLVHDGFLEFGCIYQRGGLTEEVFVMAPKFMRIWTNRPERAQEVLEAHGIVQVRALRFVDEFPHVSEAQPYKGESSGWAVVLEELGIELFILPPPPVPEDETDTWHP